MPGLDHYVNGPSANHDIRRNEETKLRDTITDAVHQHRPAQGDRVERAQMGHDAARKQLGDASYRAAEQHEYRINRGDPTAELPKRDPSKPESVRDSIKRAMHEAKFDKVQVTGIDVLSDQPLAKVIPANNRNDSMPAVPAHLNGVSQEEYATIPQAARQHSEQNAARLADFRQRRQVWHNPATRVRALAETAKMRPLNPMEKAKFDAWLMDPNRKVPEIKVPSGPPPGFTAAEWSAAPPAVRTAARQQQQEIAAASEIERLMRDPNGGAELYQHLIGRFPPPGLFENLAPKIRERQQAERVVADWSKGKKYFGATVQLPNGTKAQVKHLMGAIMQHEQCDLDRAYKLAVQALKQYGARVVRA